MIGFGIELPATRPRQRIFSMRWYDIKVDGKTVGKRRIDNGAQKGLNRLKKNLAENRGMVGWENIKITACKTLTMEKYDE